MYRLGAANCGYGPNLSPYPFLVKKKLFYWNITIDNLVMATFSLWWQSLVAILSAQQKMFLI